MLKYKTSKITEAMNDLFDAALYEADPAVTIVGNDNSELEANKSNLEHFISTAFSDHGEDISNISLTYNDNDALLAVDVNDQISKDDLMNLYKSKFDLQGKEEDSWVVSGVESSSPNSFTIGLSLGKEISNDNLYSEDDIIVLTSGTGAEVVVEDISYNNNLDELVDLVNSKNFTNDDDIVEFIETSDEVDALRGNSLDDEPNNDINTSIAEESEELSEDSNEVKDMSDDELLGLYYEIKDDIETGQWSSRHSLLPAVEEELEKRDLTPIIDNESEEVKESMKLVEYSKHDLDLYKKLTESSNTVEVDSYLLIDAADTMSAVVSYADDGMLSRDDEDYSEFFDTIDHAKELINKLDKAASSSSIKGDEALTEQVVPASELGFKHQELAKIEDEVALISKLKGEDPGNELYTDLLGCFDKAIEVLKDAIGEEPVGTVVGKEDVSINIDADNKLGGSEDESVSDLDASLIPDEEAAPEEDVDLEEPEEDIEEI